MSTKPSRSHHLTLEKRGDTQFEAPSSMVAARMIYIQRVAYDHAVRAGRPLADAADASQDVALNVLPRLRANPEFLRHEKDRIDYAHEAVTNWFRDQWRKGKRIEPKEEWIAAVIQLNRDDGVDDPTPEELLAADEAARARDAERLRRVYKAIAKLPRKARRVFRERHVKQQTAATVAKKLGKDQGTVRVQTHQALVAIRESLGVVVPDDRRKDQPNDRSTQHIRPELVP